MFVTGLLEEWMRKMEEGRQRRRLQDLRINPHYYQAFLDKQRQIWTPPELFEKCCPQFLAGGNQCEIRRKDGTYSCSGGCHKAHPTITIFFDAEKPQTVAILSHRLDPFLKYLDARVKEGTAACKTPLYYELKGFVRENLTDMKQQSSREGQPVQQEQKPYFGSHLVKVALGALKESDQVQRSLLEHAHRKRHHAKHQSDPETLEQVLNVCRMHRLGEDLDILSIHCMQQTSRTFRRVAAPMASQRMRNCQLHVTPLVDGFFTSGYSVFRRRPPLEQDDDESQQERHHLVAHREHGRMVEYCKRPPVVMSHKPQGDDDKSLEGVYVPSLPSKRNGATCCDDVQQKKDSRVGEFLWSCEELSFANLEREWGDIAVSEYCGQRIQVHWKRKGADITEMPIVGNQHYNVEDLPIFDTQLSNHAQKAEMKSFSTRGFPLKIDVQRMEESPIDDVTVSFRGKAKIMECRASFGLLVSVYSRSLEAHLRSKNQEILKSRPLLKHEEAYVQQVRSAGTLCNSS